MGQVYRRKNLRLPSYDYREPGGYFVTVCTYERSPFLGAIVDHRSQSSHIGAMVADVWNDIPRTFPEVALDAFVVMPNHIHGILFLDPHTVEQNAPLGDIMKWFKSISTNRYIHGVRATGWPPFNRHVWQSNYYEHVVRNDMDLERIRTYIEGNPDAWEQDSLFVP